MSYSDMLNEANALSDRLTVLEANMDDTYESMIAEANVLSVRVAAIENSEPSMVMVTPTHIITHHDTIPRFVSLPTATAVASGNWNDASSWSDSRVPTIVDAVRIPVGLVLSLRGVAECNDLEILGSLKLSTVNDSELKARTITILPSGSLTLGTEASPVADAVMARITLRSTALDTILDPHQFGNGIINFGTLKTYGRVVTSCVRLTYGLSSGATSVTLSSIPSDWRVGDELLFPKTAQDRVRKVEVVSRQTETRTITSISGNTINLSGPLTHNHFGTPANPFGIERFPHVGNLTRNVIVSGDAATSVRSHCLFGMESHTDIRHSKWLRLGRTSADRRLNNTYQLSTGEYVIGTNQNGRYPVHFHHAHNFTVAGCVVQDNSKWGITVHGSHRGTIENNIVYDTVGSAIVLEDTTETGNVFRNNLVAQVTGGYQKNDVRAGVVQVPVTGRPNIIDTAADGSGFWFRASAETVEDNVVYDAEGFAFNFNGYYSITPLRTVDSFTRNEAVACRGAFWLSWSQAGRNVLGFSPQTFSDFLAWNCEIGVQTYHDANFTLVNFDLIADAAVSSMNEGVGRVTSNPTVRSSVGIHLSNPSYANFNQTYDTIRCSGFNVGFAGPPAIRAGQLGTIVRHSTFSNYINFSYFTIADYEKTHETNNTFIPTLVIRIAVNFPPNPTNYYSIAEGPF